jgi:hypothetical protein
MALLMRPRDDMYLISAVRPLLSYLAYAAMSPCFQPLTASPWVAVGTAEVRTTR